jgi:Ca2+-binding RTX toxin-like protein
MRVFKISALLTVVAVLLVTATALAKVDQKGWPKITGKNKRHFFQAKQHGANKDAHYTGTEKADKILGAHGSDTLIGLGGIDVIFGDEIPNNPASQTDYIDGGAGSDFLYGSHGKSTIIGGDGNDKIHARYGHGTISCGPGKDKVWQAHKRRKNWKIASDCETITYALDSHQNRK